MTLSRQLMLSGLFLLLCLFTGMITFVARNTEVFLNQQLASHSQDTATALGLTLTTTLKINDTVTAGRIVDAVWDSGYYSSIKIEDANGKPLIDRQSQIKVYGVPAWFINLFPLQTEPKESLIMDGWSRVGKVKVESNPGFAYKQIWSTFIDSLIWFLVTMGFALLVGWMLLYIILRPLRRITAQAVAICNQQFSIQDPLPRTVDLRLVVEAMNNMSNRLKQLFEEQAQASERLREQAFKDPVTKIGNRRYFDLQFDNMLKDKEKGGSGALLLIELKNFKEYNDKYGFEAGDHLLQEAANVVQVQCQAIDSAVIARVGGAALLALLPYKTKETAVGVAAKICQSFSDFYNKGLSKTPDVGNVGIVLFSMDDSKKDILSRADMALRKAQNEGNLWHYLEQEHAQEAHGAQEWREIFDNVIRDNKVLLHFQEVQLWNNSAGKLYETLMRLKLSDKNILSAGVFMPMAERLNQIISLDKLVIQNVVNKIQHTKDNSKFSVNLSPSSMEDEEFKQWLLEQTKSLGKKASHLVIELPEYGVVNRIDMVREFFLKFSSVGGQTAIDHYGKNFSSFSYLYNLKLNYLKIDGGFVRGIKDSAENQFFVRSLVDIAHSLGIAVIAEAVETQAECDALRELKVDGVQGYYIGTPTEL